MPIERSEAIILKRRELRETSFLVNFYTRDFGRLTGVLKGARTEPAKFASTLELFSHNEIIFYPRRNSAFHLVSQCDLINSFSPLRLDLRKLGMVSLATELVDAVMPVEEKNIEVFDLFLNLLTHLGVSSNPDKILAIFKIKILSLSGFKPNLDACVLCDAKMSGEMKFSLSLGGLVCPGCTRSKRSVSLRNIFKGTVATILHIQKNDFKANLNLGINPVIKKELDLLLDSFFNFHLEKELNSQRVLNKIDNFLPLGI
ncbi:MAG: DNA repair protein RecO [Candidatus Omnitrophota bacterium]|nr:DNA repair protein RecO [Candidatus Omnitrophota bacterium]